MGFDEVLQQVATEHTSELNAEKKVVAGLQQQLAQKEEELAQKEEELERLRRELTQKEEELTAARKQQCAPGRRS